MAAPTSPSRRPAPQRSTSHEEPHARFERCRLLLGAGGLQRLAQSHVAVFGLGGVGSYAVEGLARSGVGSLALVDFDRIVFTNINRQIHALTETLGQFKTDVLHRRILAINPKARVIVFRERYTPAVASRFLNPRPDVILDCMDTVTAKMHLVTTCLQARSRLSPFWVRAAASIRPASG